MEKIITNDVSSININFHDNGYSVEYSGRDHDGSYVSVNKVFLTLREVVDELTYVSDELTGEED